jgi:hypothetical protein
MGTIWAKLDFAFFAISETTLKLKQREEKLLSGEVRT